ncbi:hypothetical protein D9757_008616 [Collybiopsis confluens]|uniref:Histone-lysine N-methyltransferase, H3 lysine-79 specific n=1 Tax=Collybiopsis confluens TaxID=2823264 RepID=A0A8H5M9Y9_9AGAR|nr:hypothetical protein D9757_008616 [Collybiopsis confluens]
MHPHLGNAILPQAFLLFLLAKPAARWFGYNPVEDLLANIALIYQCIQQEQDGEKDISQLLAAYVSRDFNSFTSTLSKINEFFKSQPTQPCPPSVYHQLLDNAYTNCIGPHLERLKVETNKAWSPEVFGELDPKFLEKIFEQANLDSRSIFLDLGSGVGNAVVLASTMKGCTAYGIEIRTVASVLASRLLQELRKKASLFNIPVGPAQVVQGDMLNDQRVQDWIKKADLILINNEVFGPTLNLALEPILLHTKVGARIVSLQRLLRGKTRATIKGPFAVVDGLYANDDTSWKNNGEVEVVVAVAVEVEVKVKVEVKVEVEVEAKVEEERVT